MNFNTYLLHGGVDRNERFGSTLSPIYQSSAFEHKTSLELEHIFENKTPGYCYTRVANPTVTSFENRITKLEGGIGTVACASGMAALFNAVMNILRSGDEIISSASLYGGSIDLFRDLEAFGITTKYVENNNWEEIERAFTERTRLVFAETIGNPKLDVTDIEKLADIAHAHGVPLIIDNTTATAYLYQALRHGADIVVNSSSKYINGSSNSISGVLTDGGRFKWDKEKYPGLKSSKWNAIARKQFTKGYGAIVTIRVGSKDRAFKLMDELKLPYILSNIGDTKTLVIHPASTISLHSTKQQREDAGVFDDLIRISVGIEDIEDLKEDFANAFAKL